MGGLAFGAEGSLGKPGRELTYVVLCALDVQACTAEITNLCLCPNLRAIGKNGG